MSAQLNIPGTFVILLSLHDTDTVHAVSQYCSTHPITCLRILATDDNRSTSIYRKQGDWNSSPVTVDIPHSESVLLSERCSTVSLASVGTSQRAQPLSVLKTINACRSSVCCCVRPDANLNWNSSINCSKKPDILNCTTVHCVEVILFRVDRRT